MTSRVRWIGVPVLALGLAALAGVIVLRPVPMRAADPVRRAVYVGVETCASCHDGPAMGDQTTRWVRTKHARAFTALARPEAREIAAISGVPIEPQKSPLCLGCHATAADAEEIEIDDSFSLRMGIQCEKCHGPGSDHVDAHSAPEGTTGLQAHLGSPAHDDCMKCHKEKPSHTRVLGAQPFDLPQALKAIAHPTPPGGKPAPSQATISPELEEYLGHVEQPAAPTAPAQPKPVYKTPITPLLSPDGRELYVTCEAAGTVCVIDTASRTKVAEIPVGGQPMDLAFSPDGKRAFVSNRLDDSVSVIDVATRKVTATIPVGDEPHGLSTDRDGKFLYVLNTSSDDISVIDTATLHEEKRLSASRSPWSLALSPDGSRFVITNALSRLVKFRAPSVSEVTVVDTDRQVVDDRVAVSDTNLLQGAAWHPSGKFALITLLRTKNLVPMTRMLQGWTITNGLGLVWADGRVDQVLLDEPSESFPDPTAIAFTPDGKMALVTSGGTDRVAVVDVERLLGLLEEASPADRAGVIPNSLAPATEFVIAHIPTARNPRGVTIAADGRTAYVACALDDAVQVLDLSAQSVAATIDLGGPKEITKARYGERLFHSANIAFRRQLSCHSCHPDGHVDGLAYDIEADGIGLSPVDNRTLRGILDTGPFKWEGTNPTLARQCGPRLSVYFTRIQPFTPQELDAVDHYISTIPRPPNRYRPLGAPLTPAQRRAA